MKTPVSSTLVIQQVTRSALVSVTLFTETRSESSSVIVMNITRKYCMRESLQKHSHQYGVLVLSKNPITALVLLLTRSFRASPLEDCLLNLNQMRSDLRASSRCSIAIQSFLLHTVCSLTLAIIGIPIEVFISSGQTLIYRQTPCGYPWSLPESCHPGYHAEDAGAIRLVG